MIRKAVDRSDPPPGLLSDSFWGKKKQQAGKWETCFWFSTFPRLAAAVEMWESRGLRFPRTVDARGKPAFGFPRRPQAVISTAVLPPALFFFRTPPTGLVLACCMFRAA